MVQTLQDWWFTIGFTTLLTSTLPVTTDSLRSGKLSMYRWFPNKNTVIFHSNVEFPKGHVGIIIIICMNGEALFFFHRKPWFSQQIGMPCRFALPSWLYTVGILKMLVKKTNQHHVTTYNCIHLVHICPHILCNIWCRILYKYSDDSWR